MNDTLTVQQAAQVLGVSRVHIYRLAKRGLLTICQSNPVYRKGGPTAIPLQQVEALRPKP